MQAALLVLNVLIMLGIVALYLRKQNGNDQTELRMELEKTKEEIRKLLAEQSTQIRQEANVAAKLNREELAKSIGNMNQSLINTIGEVASQQKNQLDSFSKRLSDMTTMNETKLERIRGTVEEKLVQLQQDNNQKLEQMRATVDEKLHATLEQRLGDSFKLVSERLELVHKGLGEMQTLANGVGDLKKVLTNVKTRGTLGELQLENLLDQTLTVEQYDKNVITKKGSNDRVEFAVKIPDKNNKNQFIHLPIDSKFPVEDYHRLLDAYEEGNSQAISENTKLLDTKIKNEAKSIRDKYIDPPNTTDFAIMFLPIEGLFAEVLRKPGLWESIQREYRVVIAGPTTLTAVLNSLQLGFQTLAIQKSSSEVWQVLSGVKTEFGKFGDILDKTQKKLQEASNHIDQASVRTRAIERKLRNVQELPSAESSQNLLEAIIE
ncbi:DNA recombination protein RmuC [Paenibacillus polysaccharolyticus]|uniref:DNA recombination protein RmuC n=1 Tax=Paenibacillus polysaccharolyticus TaxID=582692 RepID=A0A1G5JIL3_9BACL|nr:DNA recombination protein RmuC [Paenibacillus polysaccharolyticus]SCY88167.1 DNA recombination protein RmuC [Paenibacillus polysaccharolyticus]